MSRHLPPLNGLRVFEAAARHLSFTRAADELNVTQAAVSHQIKALEDHLGLALFRRLNRALMLTEEGQTLFPAVRDALDQLAEAAARLRAREESGTLTVSTLPSFAVTWLVPRMSRFQDRHPEIDLRISAKEYLVDFARDGIDVAVRFGGGRWPGLRADWLADEALLPVCSPSLRPRLQSLGDLAHVTLLHEDMLPLGRFPTWETWLAAAGASGVDATRGPRFSHTHLMLQAAMDGRGVALGQAVLVGDDLAAGRLVAPFSARLPTGFAYYVVCPPTSAERPKIRAFRDWVKSEIASSRTVAGAEAAPAAVPLRR
ncbi:MAG: transcriptional regulator GcvA [Rhodospirillales bacterium]|nr:transcriptional regulator GcvA [Rhodospirillales bacterium]